MKSPASLLAAVTLCSSTVMAYDSVVVFNEVNYAPAAGQTEFIELRNLNAVDVNMAGWTISSGVDYTFPAGTIIPGGGYLVVAANTAAISGSLGPFTGQLDNGGETLRLRNLNGRIMDELTYDDEGEWPIGADGSGATLSRRGISAAEGAEAWTASTGLGGTPGAQNFPLFVPVNRTLISSRTAWKYRDAAAAPPADWAATAFDETSWTAGDAVFGTATGGGPPTLTVTANLVERFRASAITGVADGAVVATWQDGATGDGVSQNAVAGSSTPTLKLNATPSGKPVVRFNGNAEMRTTALPGIPPTSGFAYFMVVKANAVPANGALTDGNGTYMMDRHLTGAGNPLMSLKAVNGRYGLQKRFDDGTGLGGPVSTTAISTTAYQIVSVRRNRTLNRFEMWVNGVMEATDTDSGSALNADPINLGRHGTIFTAGFVGDIAEFLLYKSELSDAEFSAVGTYLENEYGLDTAFPGSLVTTPLSAAAPTSYLRKSFNYPGDPARTTLRLNHTVADGAVFYLNGSEIYRANMPDGAVSHNTPASSIIASPAASGAIPVPAGSLLNGTNVLAVSLHKAASSPGVLFDMSMEATEMPPEPGSERPLVFNEISGAADASFYVELKNTTGAPLNTAGWTIKTSTGQTVPLPAQSIPSGGLITLNAAALGFTPADGTRLYLMAPGGSILRDAREVTNRIRGMTADGRWGHPTSATPGTSNVVAVNSDIVINEIFYHAINDGPEQWLELYNKGAAAVDISGWKFSDGVTWQFPAATSIPAGGYLVVAWDPAAFTALHPGVTAVGPWSGSLSAKGELITLRDANDNIADQVLYADGGRWSQWADGGGSSLELKDARADNSTGEAWEASDESAQSTWQTVSYSGPGTNPSGGDPATWNEFVFGLLDNGEVLIDDISVTVGGSQLIQNGNFSAGTAAFWRIIGNHSGSIQDDPLSAGNKVLKVSASGPTEHMHNHATTTLKNGASYHTISAANTYAISFRAKWLRGSNRLHTRLYCNRLARQTLLNVPATGGTPGAVNRSAVANLGPTFDALGHSPAVPEIAQDVTVSVRVSDPDGVAAVRLFTSVNGAAFTDAAMTTAGGGVYTGTIPGQATAGARVQFYVRATDVLGAVSLYPAAGPASRAMVQWQDGKAILQMPAGGKPHNLRIIVTGADANEMYKLENVMSNGSIPCTTILDEREVYYRTTVRLKSSEHGRFDANRVGFNVQFASDELFLGAHGAVSVDRSGGLAGGQGELLIRAVSNAAGGIHAPEDDIMRVIAPVSTGTGAAYNGTGLTGPAIMSKTRFDDTYLDGQWNDGGDGPIFKYERVYVLTQTINPVTRVVDAGIVPENPKIPQSTTGPPGVNVVNLGADKEFYRWYWLIENARDGDDYQKIMNAVNAIGQAAGSASFKSLTAQYLDVSTLLRAHIPSILFGVTDNYLTGAAQHNALFYFPPGGKGILIPWDLDYLSQGSTSASLTSGQDLGKFLADPLNRRLYYGHLLDVLNRSFNDAFLTRWATHYSTFGTENMTAALTYLRGRATYARNVITGTGQTPPVTKFAFSITTPGPVNTANPFVALTGKGWIDVDTIRLQGSTAPLAVTWTDDTTWTLNLPVNAGTATYTLQAYDKSGALSTGGGGTGTASITVTGSGGVFPAGPATLVISELNYNPAGSTDATEFVELLNITAATLDLAACHFDEEGGQGIAYTFPAGVSVPAGGRILIVRDAAAFAAAYPGVGPIAPGVYSGALDNGGESIVLYSASGQVILRTDYDDSKGSTDGGGYTLVRALSSTAPDPASTDWRPSTVTGGNPGSNDALPFSGNATADTDSDGLTALMEYALGTSDSVFTPANAALSTVLNPDGSMSLTWPAAANADDVILSAESSDDLGTWAPVPGDTVPAGGPRKYVRLRALKR
ncbi:MAG TPA: lamin tail domain-containing protein [Verrucomicrobiales bacterium]|nr:lamin tail domain-containing protein [Verrucomicrobiales bacterium]